MEEAGIIHVCSIGITETCFLFIATMYISLTAPLVEYEVSCTLDSEIHPYSLLYIRSTDWLLDQSIPNDLSVSFG